MAQRMAAHTTALQIYEKATGLKLIPGTLNVRLPTPVNMPSYSRIISRQDAQGEVQIYITPSLVNSLRTFVVRSKKTEHGRGRHTKDVVEIISDVILRHELQLHDGSAVVIEF
jgi:CTP-dependent riboflavin kinase